jgi:hypothetical protein
MALSAGVVGVVMAACRTTPAAPEVIKVLPHRLDAQGRHTLSPSLYDRDAYQAHLRRHPEACRAMRYDVLWRAGVYAAKDLTLRLELRGSQAPAVMALEQTVRNRGRSGGWTSVHVEQDRYRGLGEVVAWRMTLSDGAQQLAQQQSFLW